MSGAALAGLIGTLHPPVVIAYHGISAEARASGSRLLIDPARLRSQVQMLRRRGYAFRTATQLLDERDTPPRPRTAVLTFDDGWLNGLTEALPLLEALGVPATFYLNPGLWGAQHSDVAGEAGRLLSGEQALELHRRGMELGSHSMTHPDLTTLADDALARELRDSKAALEELTGEPCRTIAYPYGIYDERVSRAADAAGYELAFGWLPGPWRRFGAPRLPPPTRLGGWALRLKMRGLRKPHRPGR